MGLEIQVRITRAANPSDILWENLTVRGVCVFGTGCFILEGEKLQNQMIKEGCLTNTFSRWWQLKFLLFAPQKLGRRIHFDYCNICQLGFDFFCCFFRLNNTDHFIPKTSQKYGSSRAPPQIWQPPVLQNRPPGIAPGTPVVTRKDLCLCDCETWRCVASLSKTHKDV